MNRCITSYTSQISEYTFIAYFFIHSFFPFDANLLKTLCLCTVVACLIAMMVSEKRFIFKRTSINIPIIAFFSCLLLASFFSDHIKRNLESVFHDDIKYLVIFFGMVNTIQDQEKIKRIVKAMLITCSLVCLYGLYKYYAGHEERLTANFTHHNIIAKYLSFILPIAICLYFFYKNILHRLYLILLVCIYSFCLVLTMSRTNWIAVFIATIFITLAIQKRYLVFIVIGTCTLLIFILPSQFTNHAKTITQVNKYFSSEEVLGQRLLCWKASFAIMKDHFLFGLGPSSKNFREIYYQYAKKIRDTNEEHSQQENNMIPDQLGQVKVNTENQTEEIERISHPHNIILHIGVEIGIIGLSAFLWLFIAIFHRIAKAWQSLGTKYEKTLLVGITASLISTFIYGMTDSFWKKPDILFLWYIMGILFTIIHSTPIRNKIDSAHQT